MRARVCSHVHVDIYLPTLLKNSEEMSITVIDSVRRRRRTIMTRLGVLRNDTDFIIKQIIIVYEIHIFFVNMYCSR